MPAVLSSTQRIEAVLDLPERVLRRFHSGLIRAMQGEDSEAVDDLVAKGHLFMVRQDRRLDPELDGEDYRNILAGRLRRYYGNLYRKAVGLSWRKKTQTFERSKVMFARITHDETAERLIRDCEDGGQEPAAEAMWREVQEFLGDLGTLKTKAVGGLLAGETKAQVAKNLGLHPSTLDRLLEDTFRKLRERGVL